MSTVILTDEEAKHVIAYNVSRFMDERRMTQRQLAEAAGENDMAISRVVRALHVPSAALLARIADALEVTADELLTPPKNLKKPA
ncbi:MAG: helix-turn-helix domain-containing protein [Acidobacteriales bacterium]|nr:helix-turn-helix domain-containing protein [Terriglobales bacterium]